MQAIGNLRMVNIDFCSRGSRGYTHINKPSYVTLNGRTAEQQINLVIAIAYVTVSAHVVYGSVGI